MPLGVWVSLDPVDPRPWNPGSKWAFLANPGSSHLPITSVPTCAGNILNSLAPRSANQSPCCDSPESLCTSYSLPSFNNWNTLLFQGQPWKGTCLVSMFPQMRATLSPYLPQGFSATERAYTTRHDLRSTDTTWALLLDYYHPGDSKEEPVSRGGGNQSE